MQAEELSHAPLFSQLSVGQRRKMARLMTTGSAAAGTVMTEQGAPGRQFMFFREGTATVEQDGQIVAELGSGDFAGELSLLTGEPCNATVTATSDVVVQVLNRREFLTMLDYDGAVCREIMETALKRVQ